jgi:hypothetical protein
MGKAKPKLGVPPGYWIKPFTLVKSMRQLIKKLLGKEVPAEFFEALESALEDFIAYDEFKANMPKMSNVNAALDEIHSKSYELAELLSERKGIDFRTRDYIDQISQMRGMPGGVIGDCQKALIHLYSAIELTRDSLKKQKIRKGRPVETTQEEFIYRIYEIFTYYRFNPKATIGGKFENCVWELLNISGRENEEGNIHRLSMIAAKRHRLINTP